VESRELNQSLLREEAKPILAKELLRRNLHTAAIDNEVPAFVITHPKPRFSPALRFGGVLLLNTCIAVVGTSAMAAEIGRAFHPHSLYSLVWKLWGLHVVCAMLIGYFMWRTRKAEATKWTWTIPALWLGLRLILALLSREHQSVLVTGGVWPQFSGVECENGVRASGCLNLFVFTLPFVASVSYSIGAYLSLMTDRSNPPLHANE
jgi:hypothetical protein